MNKNNSIPKELLNLAIDILETPEAANRWLNCPQLSLGGMVPAEVARTVDGVKQVKDILIRIEYGIFS